jgi:thiamine-phosphate pyrophosphorylase
MKRSRVSGIYAITPQTEDTAGLVTKVAAALAGGVRIVQYRNKTGSASLRRAQCGALVERLRDVNGTLIVNDDSRLAVDVDADGVHLGKDDDSLADSIDNQTWRGLRAPGFAVSRQNGTVSTGGGHRWH